MNGCFGMTIVQVEPGTVIKNRHGDELTVTDDNAVHSGGTVYLTPKNYDGLKAATQSDPLPINRGVK